jgi:hypothetical protein
MINFEQIMILKLVKREESFRHWDLKYRKKGLFRTNFSFFVKFKRHKSKDRSESYVHIYKRKT